MGFDDLLIFAILFWALYTINENLRMMTKSLHRLDNEVGQLSDRVFSVKIEEGQRETIWRKIRRGTAPPEVMESVRSIKGREKNMRKKEINDEPTKIEEGIYHPAIGKKKGKIVMIEDAPLLLEIYLDKFQEGGFDIKVFSIASKELVDEIAKDKPDIISMDIILPKISGYEMTKLLKKDKRTKDIPIIGFDNLGQPEEKNEAIDSGMDAYYVKAHYTPGEYINIIENHIKNYKSK